jgi:hypothetical protein
VTREQINTWAAAYKRSWEALDKSGYLSLFTPDAVIQATPFSRPRRGKEIGDAWDEMTRRQSNSRIDLEIWCAKDDLVILHWTARATLAGQGPLDGDGIDILRFDDDGRCRDSRQWQHWHRAGAPHTKDFKENEAEMTTMVPHLWADTVSIPPR